MPPLRIPPYCTGGDLYTDTPASGPAYEYDYNARKRLVVIKQGGTAVANYAYDFRDQRVARTLTTGGTSTYIHYVYDEDGHVLGEYNGATGAVLREYVWLDDTPVAVVDSTSGTATAYYIHTGHLDEPQVMTNASKAKVWDAYVNPFGKATTFASPTVNSDIRLPGQWYQAESAAQGLNQNHFRDYDPSLGRYIEADPIGLAGGQNPYAYVDGRPYDATDPDGRDCASAKGVTICVAPDGTVFGVPTPKGFPARLQSGGPLYHAYAVKRKIKCASPNAVLKALINTPTPDVWTPSHPATPLGTANNAKVIPFIDNPVVSYVTIDVRTGRQIVVNMTNSNSQFKPGYVVRYVDNGVAYTVGEGDNSGQSPSVTGPSFQWEINEWVWGGQMDSLIDQAGGNCGCGK